MIRSDIKLLSTAPLQNTFDQTRMDSPTIIHIRKFPTNSLAIGFLVGFKKEYS